MTRQDVVNQVMARVKVSEGTDSAARAALDRWLDLYPGHFKFGPASVQAGVRLIERELVQLRKTPPATRAES